MSSGGSGEASANSTAATTRASIRSRISSRALWDEHALGLEPVGEDLDRVLLAPLLDLLLGPVDLGVGGRVAAEAVGERLDHRRPALLAGDPDVLGDRLAHRQHVHAVGAHARARPRPSAFLEKSVTAEWRSTEVPIP